MRFNSFQVGGKKSTLGSIPHKQVSPDLAHEVAINNWLAPLLPKLFKQRVLRKQFCPVASVEVGHCANVGGHQSESQCGRGSKGGLYLEANVISTEMADSRPIGDKCPLCQELGRNGTLELRQINAYDALWICGNSKVSTYVRLCPYAWTG